MILFAVENGVTDLTKNTLSNTDVIVETLPTHT